MNAQHEIQHSKPEQICSLSQELSNRHQIQIADIFVFALFKLYETQ